MQYDDAVKLIRQSSYQAHQEYLISKLLPTVLITSSQSTVDEIAIGNSRFGGMPDVPQDFEWPHSPNGEPLAFLAQLDLEEIANIHQDNLLPQNGWLLFFYQKDSDSWRISVEDFGNWKVCWVEAERNSLNRTTAPGNSTADRASCFKPCSLQFESTLLLPTVETLQNDDPDGPFKSPYGAPDEEPDKVVLDGSTYEDELEALVRPIARLQAEHRLLGYPFEEQAAMANGFSRLIEAVPQREGTNPFTGERMIFKGHPAPDCSPELKELLDNSTNWRLLLQLASESSGPEWMWGDAGRIYFWIPEERLKQRDFDSVWLILQCG